MSKTNFMLFSNSKNIPEVTIRINNNIYKVIIIIINLYFRRVLVHIHTKEEEKKRKKEIHDRKQTKQTNPKK